MYHEQRRSRRFNFQQLPGHPLAEISPSAQDIDILRQGVVKVVPQGGSRSQTSAAGFIVRAEARALFIVTASHVIEGAEQVGIEFFDERRLYQARVLGLEGGDPRGLAALIVENDVPSNVVVLGFNRELDVRAGELVTMIGFPAAVGAPWAVTKGSVVGRRGQDIVFAGAVEAGNSGGPLVKDDQVVGLITEAQGPFAFATPSVIVEYALESWGVRFGVRLRSVPVILESELVPLFKAKGFSHPSRTADDFSRRNGVTMETILGRFRHEYEPRMLDGVRVVLDHATGLMWRQAASAVLDEDKRTAFIDDLNSSRHAGFNDWRLPTIEELGSLLEPRAAMLPAREPRSKPTFLDETFEYDSCMSADEVFAGNPFVEQSTLGIRFTQGALFAYSATGEVCAVRSMKPAELRQPIRTNAR